MQLIAIEFSERSIWHDGYTSLFLKKDRIRAIKKTHLATVANRRALDPPQSSSMQEMKRGRRSRLRIRAFWITQSTAPRMFGIRARIPQGLEIRSVIIKGFQHFLWEKKNGKLKSKNRVNKSFSRIPSKYHNIFFPQHQQILPKQEQG